MELSSSIASLGFIPAIYITGRLALINILEAKVSKTSAIGQIALEAVVGMICWLVVLFGLAAAGIYSPPILGACGWLTTGIGCYWLVRRSEIKSSPRNRFDFLMAGFAIVLFAWNATYSAESLLAGRDQGVYALHGISIAETGSTKVEFFNKALLEYNHRSLLHGARVLGFGYNLIDDVLEAQFPPALALLLAQFYGIGGYAGLTWLVPFLSSLNLLLVFEISKRATNAFWAVWASLFFALNPAQLWNSRITLSEIPAQSLILTGILIATIGLTLDRRKVYIVGAVVLVSSCFVRVDSYLLFAIVPVIGFSLQLLGQQSVFSSDTRVLLACSSMLIALYVIAYFYYRSLNHYYFDDFVNQVYLLGTAGLSVTALHLISVKGSARFDRASRFPRIFALRVFAAALIVGLVYCIFIRPHIEPYSQFENSHYGTRDYRENSVNDLAAYISHIVIILGTVGAILVAWRSLKWNDLRLLPLLLIWIVFAIIYLQDPRISPDHIWRIRRFTPIVIPGFIILSAFTGYWLENKLSGNRLTSYSRISVVLLSIAFLGHAMQPIAFLKQYEGAASMIETIAAEIEDDGIVFTGVSPRYFGPVAIAKKKRIIRGDLGNADTLHAFQSMAKSEIERGKPVYILSHKSQLSPSARLTSSNWHFEFPKLKGSNTAPATEIEHEVVSLYLERLVSELSAFSGREKQIVIGNQAYLGITENGMYEGPADGDGLRWTSAKANFTVPMIFERPFETGKIDIAAASPKGARLKLKCNGTIVLDTFAEKSGGRYTFSLADAVRSSDKTMFLELECDTWIPAEEEPGSTDTRSLGLRLAGIQLDTGLRESFGEVGFGAESLPGIPEQGLHQTEFRVGKPLRWTNGHAIFNIQSQTEFTVNRLTIKLHDRLVANANLRIVWNGNTLWESHLENPDIELEFLIDPQSSKAENILELISDATTPKSMGNEDTRMLGVMIEDLHIYGNYTHSKEQK